MNFSQKGIWGQSLGGNLAEASLDFSPGHPLSNKVIGKTHIGRGREKNQDALSAYFHTDHGEKIILCMADGLGSYFFSEKSSFIAVSSIPEKLADNEDIQTSCMTLHQKFLKAHPYEMKNWQRKFRQYLKEKLADKKNRGNQSELKKDDCGATTLVVAQIQKNELTVSNIGDSRAYVIRDQKIIYQTKDQSLVEFLRAQNKLTPELSKKYKSAILNSLGSPNTDYQTICDLQIIQKKSGTPITDTLELAPGDIIILATDGFFTNLTEDELLTLVTRTPWEQLEDSLTNLIKRVLKTGWTNMGAKSCPDNFSFLVYRH